MTLIEKDSKQLKDHFDYWNSVRKENIIGYYARQEGYNRLGMQPLPVLTVLEYKAKEAIKMKLLISSLMDSAYASEQWTLAQCSAEAINTAPKNCFKKGAFTVTVFFDNDPDNRFPYTCWDSIYYQDDNSTWHKTAGLVDSNGLYFKEHTGDAVYFTLFLSDAERYGQTGNWTIQYKNETVFASITSSSTRVVPEPPGEVSGSSKNASPSPKTPRKRKRETDEDTSRQSPTSTKPGFRLRRGGRGQQGEHTPRATRGGRGNIDTPPSAEEVGSRSRTVEGKGLTRLGRLLQEARDPSLICLQGPANTLKCFRYRCFQRYAHLFVSATTAFHWVGDDNNARILIAFYNDRDRDTFLKHVTLPKNTTHCFGTLDCF